MSEYKEHVKLFKSGKLWTSALVGTAFSAGVLGVNPINAHADDGQNTTANQMQQGTSVETKNTVTLDSPSQTSSVATSEAAQSTSATVESQAISTVSTQNSQAATTRSATSASASQPMTMAATTEKYADGTYQTDTSKAYRKADNTSEKSTMQNFMADSGSIKIAGDKATVTLPAKNSTNAQMITKMTLNGQTALVQGDNFVFELSTTDLNQTLIGQVDINVPGVIEEQQPFALILDLSQVATEQPVASESNSSQAPSESQNSENSSSQTPSESQSSQSTSSQTPSESQSSQSNSSQTPSESQSSQNNQVNRKLKDGTYDLSAKYLKPNSSEVSPGMSRSLLSGARVTISGNRATLEISAANAQTAAMIPNMTINGVTGVKDGSTWSFDLSTASLATILNGSVDISVPGFSETQNFGIDLDLSAIPTAETVPESQTPDSQKPESQTPDSQKPESQTPESQKPESQTPDSQKPESQTPDSQKPESQTPDSQKPESQTPDSQKPESQTPDSQKSDAQSLTPRQQTSEITDLASVAQASTSGAAQTLDTTSNKNKSKQQLDNLTVDQSTAQQRKAHASLPNTGSDTENVLTGLGVLIGTLGLGGLLKKRH